MTFKYVLKWRMGEKSSVVVEAWSSSPRITLPKERKKPSFVIGSAKGKRTIILMGIIEELKKKYKVKNKNGLYRIDFPFDNIEAIADVYRIGLASQVVSKSKDFDSADGSLQYVLRSTTEEIWFWASKLLGVVDSKVDASRVMDALTILSSPNSSKKYLPHIKKSPEIMPQKSKMDQFL
jgi:hypothetical protein